MFEYILNKAEVVRNINYLLIPVNQFELSEEGVKNFNKVYFDIKKNCKNFSKIVRTPSGSISINKRNFRPYMWDVRELKSCVEITVIAGFSGMFRVQLRSGKKDHDDFKIWGRTAFAEFKKLCKKHNIDLKKFYIDNGFEVKQQIQKPFICFEKECYEAMTFEHVHHIDLNSSYMSGIAKTFPELFPVIKEAYDLRKDETKNSIYKAILTHTCGFMQSSQIKYSLSHMSKAAIDFNNEMILNIRQKMIEQGFKPILYNTDGIWYTHHDGIQYHDENEGKELGQWKNDHTNCIFQALSPGKYHYIENGVCETVLRGQTRLDKMKDRSKWTWKDLYDVKNTEIMYVKFDEEEGATFFYE